MIFIESISEAVCSMTSNLLGQGRRAEMPKLIRKSMQLGYFVVAPLLLVALLFPEEVLSIFTPDAAIIELSLSGYTIVLLALVLAIPGDMLYAAVVGTGDTRATLGIQLVATAAALAFTLWAALVMSFPLEQVLFVEIIVWTLYLLLSWYWLRSGRWRQLKV
jgi:Na+-driven multidrug efflux pump